MHELMIVYYMYDMISYVGRLLDELESVRLAQREGETAGAMRAPSMLRHTIVDYSDI